MTNQTSPIADNLPLDQAVPRQSNYLSKEDVDPEVLAHISHMTLDAIEMDGKWDNRAVLHFHGDLKPMVLNQTNKELLKIATGAQTAGQVKNCQIILYNDPTIMFAGKMTGGIRIKAVPNAPAIAAGQAATAPTPGHTAMATAPVDPFPGDPHSDIPFPPE